MGALKLLDDEHINTHVVDILGNIKGRDQPIMLMKKAIDLVSMLGEDVLTSDEVVFFDPFCKGGEILLAAAFARNLYKSKKKKHLVDVQKIQDDMFNGNRYFALAPDERHFRLSLRTFLGNEKSHIEKYIEIIKNGNYLSETDGKLDEKRFEKEFKNMINHIKKSAGSKKIIAIGNPPYHEEDDGDSTGSGPIYQYFIEQIIASQQIDQFIFVIPSRWFVLDSKGLGDFRKMILQNKKLKTLRYFEKAEQVFPSVQVKGGVCFIHWDDKHNGDTNFVDNMGARRKDLSKYDKIPDDPGAEIVLDKVFSRWPGKSVGEIAWSRNPFGLATNHFKNHPASSQSSTGSIACYTLKQEIKFTLSKFVTKNKDKIDTYKVAVPKGYGKGMRRCTMPIHKFFIIKKGEITTDTHIILGDFKTLTEAENFMFFLKTDFSRYLLGLRKLTQDASRDRWEWIPFMDISKKWSDSDLFKYFNINKQEQEHIKKKVKEWS